MENTSSDSNSTGVISFLGPSSLDLSWQIVLAVAIALPNALLLYILLFMIKEWTYSNMCFISMTISDFVMGAVVIPLAIFWLGVINLNIYLGAFIVIVVYTQPQVSLNVVLVFSWHRLKHLIWPAESTEQLTTLRIIILVALWVVNYAAWFILVVVFIKVGYYDFVYTDILPPNYVIVILDMVCFGVPLVANMIIIGVTIYFILRRAVRKRTRFNVRLPSMPLQIQSTEKMESSQFAATMAKLGRVSGAKFRKSRVNRDMKSVFCLISLGMVYFWTQIFYDVTWPMFRYNILTNYTAYSACVWLGYCNSLFNPWVVFIFHDKVQAALKKLAGKVLWKNQV